jgi:hypothetical protein
MSPAAIDTEKSGLHGIQALMRSQTKLYYQWGGSKR